MSQIPFFISMPHSGEKIPEMCTWLNHLPETTVMCDVDRYIDRLYTPALNKLQIPFVKTDWHRYAVDLNRLPSDIDSDSVIGSENKSGSFSRGFHWVVTTHDEKILPKPMSLECHLDLIKLIYDPFHQSLKDTYRHFEKKGAKNIFHLDAHSMPSKGTSQHRDPGEYRADIVVSDSKGKSCNDKYKDLVILSYISAGFKVGYNWPYFGGRLTEEYGKPDKGHHVVQVELNRNLYMNEQTKKIRPDIADVQNKIECALVLIQSGLAKLSI